MLNRKFVGTAAVALVLAMSVPMVGCGSSSSSSSSSSDTQQAEQTEEASTASSIDGVESTKDMYVDWAYVEKNFDDITFVDARSADVYAVKTVKGAVNIPWANVSNMSVIAGKPGWAEISDAQTVADYAASLGITGDSTIVIFCSVEDGWGEDGRIYWQLREAGLTDVHILDGGWSMIQENAAKGQLAKGKATADEDATADFEATDQDPITQVDTAYVQEHSEDATLVDARAAEEYNGELKYYEARKGHIPGAINVPIVGLVNEDGTIKSDEELQAIFNEAGLTDKSAKIITYCTGGVRGAFLAEQLVRLGYTDVSVYTAGATEWSGDLDNSMEM